MSAWRRAVLLLRERPALWIAWLAALALPAMLAFVPLDLALEAVLDLRPAAAAMLRTPMDDSLLGELRHLVPGLQGVTTGGLAVTLLLGVPLLWLLAGHVAASAIESYAPARIVAGRSIGVAIAALPLRALPWMGALAIGLPIAEAQTIRAALPAAVGAIAFYLLGAAAVGVLVDFARGAALADVERGLFGSLGEGFAAVRRQPGLYAGLVLLELLSLGLAVLAAIVTRPLGLFSGATLLLALGVLVLRSIGAVLGVAAAARGAMSRSA